MEQLTEQLKKFKLFLTNQFRDGFFNTKVLNPGDISNPIVEAINKKKYDVLDPESVSAPIVAAIQGIDFPEKIEQVSVKLDGVSLVAIKGDKGEPGNDGYTPKKGTDYVDGEDGKTPVKFKDYFTKLEIDGIIAKIQKSIKIPADGKDGVTPVAGKDYPTEKQILEYISGIDLPVPKDGLTPDHKWEGTTLFFQKPDGSWDDGFNIAKNMSQARGYLLENPDKQVSPTHAGIDNLYAITSNGNGTVNVPKNSACFYDDTKTKIERKTIAAAPALSLVNQANNYIAADRNTGTWVVFSDPALIDEVRYLYYSMVYRSGNSQHIQTAPLMGYGEVENDFTRALMADKYKRVSGMENLAVDASLSITADAGEAYCNNTLFDILPVTTATVWFFAHHVAGIWVSTFHANTPVIDNAQYDNGTDLVQASSGTYVINYLFRGIESANHLYITLGKQQFSTLAEARAYTVVPELPITNHAILIGRVIVKKNSTTEIYCNSAFAPQFPTVSITQHNDLSNLQGGVEGEKYHLSSDEYTNFKQIIISDTPPTNHTALWIDTN